VTDETDPGTLRVPAAFGRALRGAVLAGAEGEHRLREAGYEGGHDMYDRFAAWMTARGHRAPPDSALGDFATALSAFTADEGWGTLRLPLSENAGEAPGAVALEADGWFEATVAGSSPYPACHYTTGLLAGFFGRLAGAPLAVLETACAAAGAPACRFLVGAPGALARVYEARFRP